MDRFLANADPDRRQQSIELTRAMATKRSRLHQLTKANVSQVMILLTAANGHARYFHSCS